MRCTAKPSATPTAIAIIATVTRPGCARHSPRIIQRAALPPKAVVSAAAAIDQSLARQRERSVRDRGREIGMCNEKGRRACAAHFLREELEDTHRGLGIEIACRLVGEQQRRAMDERACD